MSGFSDRIALPVMILMIALSPTLADTAGACGPRLGQGQASKYGYERTPSSDAARSARERTQAHGELEGRRGQQRLDRMNRQADTAAARQDAARARPEAPLERESQSRRRQRTVRGALPGERRLDVDRELAEVDRLLSSQMLGPATRSAVERYRRELLAERTAEAPAPSP